jgi:hypothetical protein
MELYALALLAGAGYAMTRMRKAAPPPLTPDSPDFPDSRESRETPGTRYDRGGHASYASPVSPDFKTYQRDFAEASLADRSSSVGVYDSVRWDEVRADEFRRGEEVLGGDRVVKKSFGGGTGHVRSQLLDVELPIERFTHNNMVPFYGGSVKQSGVDDDRGGGGGGHQNVLETFTGNFSFRPGGNKKEIEAIWKPTSQGEMNSSGRAVHGEDREAWLAMIGEPVNRANEAPMGLAPVVVGRAGIRGGETGDVYYDQREYMRGKTVDELRPTSRPKLTFESRPLGPGKAIAPDSSLEPMVPEVRERSFKPLTEEFVTTDQLLGPTSVTNAEVRRTDDYRDIRTTNRQTTAANSYVGSASPSSLSQASPAGRDPMARPTTHRSTMPAWQQGGAFAPNASSGGGDHGRSSVQVYGNNRDVTTVRTIAGSFASAIKAIVAPIQDVVRTTKREETSTDSAREFGNPSIPHGVPKLTIYDAKDVARTTLKQVNATEEFALANLSGPSRATVYDANDVARTTIKQTNAVEEYALTNLSGPSRSTVYDPSDVARTTLKQVNATEEFALANLSGPAGSRARDPSDVARTTLKQVNATEERPLGGMSGHSKSTVYDPSDVARTTLKQVNAVQERPLGGMSGHSKSTAYDPTDVARTTMRQTNATEEYALTNFSGVVKATVYDPDDVARTTRKQTNATEEFGLTNYSGHSRSIAYDPQDVARTSRKETTLAEPQLGNVRSITSKTGTVVDPSTLTTFKTTGRETTEDFDINRNMSSQTVSKGSVADSDVWRPGKTNREITGEVPLEFGGVSGSRNAGKGGHTTEYEARTTMREISGEMLGTSYGASAPSAAFPGGQASPMPDDLPRTTQKEGLSDNDYFGSGRSDALGPTSETSARAMEILSSRDDTLLGRSPTQVGPKSIGTVSMQGLSTTNSSGGLTYDRRGPTAGVSTVLSPGIGSMGRVDPPKNKNDESNGQHIASDRLTDEVAGHRSQSADNPLALRDFFQ